MVVSLNVRKLFVATFVGYADGIASPPAMSLIQRSVDLDAELDIPPISATTEQGDFVISVSTAGKSWFENPEDSHPHAKKKSTLMDNGDYIAGYKGDRSNILQWIMNALVYCEVNNLPRVRLDMYVHKYLADGMFPDLPNPIEVNRPVSQGRLTEKTQGTISCGIIQWGTCHVSIGVRAKIAEYYFKPHMPSDCGDPEYKGLVIQLRRPEWKLPDYMQPPCQMYAKIIEEGKYKSIRVFGERWNVCGDWLKAYSDDHGIDMDYVVNRSFKMDWCEAARAKNFVMSVSTMSQNAVFMGERTGRHLYQMLPHCDDLFLFFGKAGRDGGVDENVDEYFKEMCEIFDGTGYTLDDVSYWQEYDFDEIAAKQKNQTIGINAVSCKKRETTKM